MGAYTTTVIQMVITGGGQYLIEDKLLGTTCGTDGTLCAYREVSDIKKSGGLA